MKIFFIREMDLINSASTKYPMLENANNLHADIHAGESVLVSLLYGHH